MQFWYFSLVENPVLHSGSIRMEGMHFASKIEDFACKYGWKTLTNRAK